jgi:hypothetical protein
MDTDYSFAAVLIHAIRGYFCVQIALLLRMGEDARSYTNQAMLDSTVADVSALFAPNAWNDCCTAL